MEGAKVKTMNGQKERENFPERADSLPGALRILLVDDNRIVRRVVATQLAGLGYQVETASNGLEALQRAQQVSFDVILMDLEMPELGGLEATRRLRATLPPTHQPVIVAVTGYSESEERECCHAAGMELFLAKPFSLEELQAVLAPLGRR